jgi:hypothetical protein
MKYLAFLGAMVLAMAFAAHAQSSSGPSFALGTPAPSISAVPAFALAPASAATFAVADPAPAPADPAPAGPEPAPQGVYGVLQNYNWQAYAGFSHISFYELPNQTGQLNGFNMSIVFYPKGGHWAADGEFATGFAPQFGITTRLALGLGGVRYRVDIGRGLEIWGHGMVGGAHFYPQTEFGSQDAVAFDIGAGVDVNPHHRRLGFRGAVDWTPTLFFGTHQYNVRESIGVVYRF